MDCACAEVGDTHTAMNAMATIKNLTISPTFQRNCSMFLIPQNSFIVKYLAFTCYDVRMPAHFDTDAEDAKLARARACEEEDLAHVLSEKYDLPYTDLSVIPINMDALRVIPKADAENAGVVAFDKNGKHLLVAMRTPNGDAVEKLLGELESAGYILEKYLVSEASINKALLRYDDLSLTHSSRSGVFDISSEELMRLRSELTSLPALRSYLAEAVSVKNATQVSKLLEGMLAAAFSLQASDIHLEPGEGAVRLRLRLDGVLTDSFSFDEHAYRLLNSRIKVLSGLKLNVTDRAQDGRFSVDMGGAEVEIRTSAIPGNYGESIVLRQDPDVIMVGEIRDAEVAEVALQAALTGHFVFSTLHTNNAAGAFPRLVDLGADPKTFASAITVAMGQRLLRTLNQETKVRRKTTDEEKKIIELIFSSLTDESLRPFSTEEVWAANPQGEDTGYKGRVGVHEAIFMDEELGEFLRTNPSMGDIEKSTRRQGFLTMAQDGVLKALAGETSLEEVFKVVDVPRG